MTNLAGHDLGLLLETFNAVKDEQPKLFIVYTIKGIGLPFQGHKDNHSGLMTQSQMALFQAGMGVAAGAEWDRFAGLPRAAADYESFLAATAFAAKAPSPADGAVAVPSAQDFPRPTGRQSTQVAFGKVLNDLARQGGPLADAIVTTSPDVTVSTNLGGFVNQRGLFARKPRADLYKEAAIASPQKWTMGPAGQHFELGIAEHNLFLMLAAAGLSNPLFGRRLIPVGTLYDPFINRGLDALNYACYQDARFLLVGHAVRPHPGARGRRAPVDPHPGDRHGAAGPDYFEPAFADELVEILRWGFEHLQAPDGGSVYLRLSTRPLDQPERSLDEAQIAAAAQGRLLAGPARPGGGAGGGLRRRDGAGGHGRLRGDPRGHPRRRPAGRAQPRPAASRLEPLARRARQGRAGAGRRRTAPGPPGAPGQSPDRHRRSADDAVLAWRRPGPSRRTARRRPVRPVRRHPGPLSRLRPGRGRHPRRRGHAIVLQEQAR